ncbi:MAG: WYL domain-containing protein [Bacteroidales bacterium]|nr:WYL domain-containing protein [Bacteroidales bacterium]
MSSSKAIHRYRLLDKCFRDTSREYTLTDLLDVVNRGLSEMANPKPVSERQLYVDIAYMRSPDGLDAEIDTFRIVRPDENGHNRPYTAYRYHDPTFSIDHVPLTTKQAATITSAMESLRIVAGLPQFAWIQESFKGMRAMADYNINVPRIQLDVNPYLGGPRAMEVYKHFEQIFTAIQDKQSLVVEYCCFKNGPCTYHFHPCFFKQFRGFWYAFGVTTSDPENILTLAMDRISGIKPCSDTYIDIDFDPQSYFYDFIGVINTPEPPVKVHLQFKGWAAPYVENCPLHGSQQASWIEVDGERVLDVKLFVKLNEELEGALLYYCDCCKVLSPESLIERHHNHLIKAMKINGLM